MALECTLVRAPGAAEATPPEELSIDVPDGTSGAHMQLLLTEARGTGSITVGGHPLITLTVGKPPLLPGAVLVDDAPTSRRDRDTPSSLMLLAHSGPGAGSIFRIQRGRYRIGRASTDIPVPDPGMSREHAVLEVSSTAIALRALSRANPVFVDKGPASRALLTPEVTVRCGNSRFTVITASGPYPRLTGHAGLSVKEPLEIRHTRRQGNRLTLVLAAGLPLLAGIGLSLATGMWMYMAFTAISAISLLVPMLAGRKDRLEARLAIVRAVKADVERRRLCSPSAAELVLSVLGPPPGGRPPVNSAMQNEAVPPPSATPPGSPAPGPGVWLRLGVTQAVANVQLVPDDPSFNPPSIGAAAMTLDPGHPEVAVCGRRHHTDALLRFVLMQLTSFPGAAQASVIVLGPQDRLPLSARFLPRVTLTSNLDTAMAAVQQANGQTMGRLILVDDHSLNDPDSVLALLKVARSAGWPVLRSSDSSRRSAAVIKLSRSGTEGHLEADGQNLSFVPDLVPAEVFDAYCRRSRATYLKETHDNLEVPSESSLAELLPGGHRRTLRRWTQAAGQDSLTAILGAGAEGPIAFDFTLDGPHLLIAGTTGAGKSELLRTLVSSIALIHPPDHATFVFFDFKGGSGLQPLAQLPHCMGLLTDLSKHHLERALASLRGEIRYREELFAAAGVSDLKHYRRASSPPLPKIPYLVLVIDEFRMLIEDAPIALHELMRIATIGRSLGIHLVMATQRPQGALNADIRANVTSSIAMRVQTEAESVDIINSKAAAFIPVDTPGRAYLAKASGSPEEFQTATVAIPPTAAAPGTGLGSAFPPVQSALLAIGRPTSRHITGRKGSLPDTGPEHVVSTVSEAWQLLGHHLPKRPIALPLPTSILWEDRLPVPEAAGSCAEGRWTVGPLGVVDRPTHQVVESLVWAPSEDGHLAMIGSESSGMGDCFLATSAMLATNNPQPHIYILDATGTLGHLGEEARIGAAVGLHQLHLATSVLQGLATEMERRRSSGMIGIGHSPLVLMVSGWCSWATALRNGPLGFAEGIMQDIVRDGSSLGVTVLISGERELVSSRFFAAIQNRAYFPSGSTEESRFHWPRLPDMEPLPGRAVVMGNFATEDGAVAQFRVAPPSAVWPFDVMKPAEPPFRVRPLPHRLGLEDFKALLSVFRGQSPQGGSRSGPTDGTPEPVDADDTLQTPLWIGVGGNDAAPVALPLRDPCVSAILGRPRSGKSSILAALPSLNPSVPFIYPSKLSESGDFWVSVAQDSAAGHLAPNSILLVDDADQLDAHGRQALTDLSGRVRCIILAVTPGPYLLRDVPLAREAQASGIGLVLAPATPHDGDLFGVRLDIERNRTPGRGFLINGPEILPFQGVIAKHP